MNAPLTIWCWPIDRPIYASAQDKAPSNRETAEYTLTASIPAMIEAAVKAEQERCLNAVAAEAASHFVRDRDDLLDDRYFWHNGHETAIKGIAAAIRGDTDGKL